MARFPGSSTAGLKVLAITALSTVVAASTVDSGWTPVFDGKTFDGLYLRTGRAELRNPATSNQVRIESDGRLTLPNPGPAGALCTKADLSYYHARIRYHFPTATGTPNAGMLYHVDSLDWLPTDAFGSNTVDRVPSLQPSCGGSWFPKGWEIQMRRGQTGALYGVANVWGETTMRNAKWDPAGAPHSLTPSYSSGPKMLNPSVGDWPDGPGEWVTMEILVYGADSAIHVVNGTRVFKVTRLRHNRIMVPCGQGGGTWGTGAQLPLTNGKHCVQIEGANMTYRDWEMRPLPKGGTVATRPANARSARTGYGLVGQSTPQGMGLLITAPAAHKGLLQLEIRRADGSLVRSFTLAGGSVSLAWDRTDAAGHRVPEGLFVARLLSADATVASALLALPPLAD